MKIARVFIRRNSYTPIDADAWIGAPDLFTPHYDEAHISCVFTWDIPQAQDIAQAWQKHADKVLVGGCALNDAGGDFVSGCYIRQGITITSRGCPNKCPWCYVPKREGAIRELPIVAGNVVQDNNLLACSKAHIDRVFSMLRRQKGIDFAGGLEASRVTSAMVEKMRGLSIRQIWLAFDHGGARNPLERALEKLRPYFKQYQIRIYLLSGYFESDTPQKAEDRARWVCESGALPFVMLYQGEDGKKEYSSEWRTVAKVWSRPASIKSMWKGGKSVFVHSEKNACDCIGGI